MNEYLRKLTELILITLNSASSGLTSTGNCGNIGVTQEDSNPQGPWG